MPQFFYGSEGVPCEDGCLVGKSQQPSRKRLFTKPADPGVVPAIRGSMDMISLFPVQGQALVDVFAALVERPKHVKRSPLAMMRLQAKVILANGLGKDDHFVCNLPAFPQVHLGSP